MEKDKSELFVGFAPVAATLELSSGIKFDLRPCNLLDKIWMKTVWGDKLNELLDHSDPLTIVTITHRLIVNRDESLDLEKFCALFVGTADEKALGVAYTRVMGFSEPDQAPVKKGTTSPNAPSLKPKKK